MCNQCNAQRPICFMCSVCSVGLECLVAAWECAEQSSLGPRGGGGGCGGVGGQLVEVEEGNLPTAHCGLPAHTYLSASFSSQLVVVTVQLLPLLDKTASLAPLPLQTTPNEPARPIDYFFF